MYKYDPTFHPGPSEDVEVRYFKIHNHGEAAGRCTWATSFGKIKMFERSSATFCPISLFQPFCPTLSGYDQACILLRTQSRVGVHQCFKEAAVENHAFLGCQYQ